MNKIYLSAQELLEDSFRLGARVYKSGFRPSVIIAIRTSSYSSGIDAVINHMRDRARLNTPQDIRVEVPYYKPTRNETTRVPDYYLHETEAWLKFPHSLEGLSEQEIATHRPEIYAIVKGKRR